MTAQALNRTTLRRQLLLERADLSAEDGVRAAVLLQAQEPASPFLALWTRLREFDAASLAGAFASARVVKATLMRITLHAVHRDDHPAFHAAMEPSLRASRLNDRRFTALGLSAAETEELLARALRHLGQPRTNAEMDAVLAEWAGASAKPGPWWALRTFAPALHAPGDGPWSFGPRPAYVAHGWPPAAGERVEHVAHVVRRLLEGFGPASVLDLAQQTMLSRPLLREALQLLGPAVRELRGPDGQVLHDVRDGELLAGRVPVPARLLPMWDSTLLAYADRSRVIPPDYRRLVIRSNGDVLPAVLVDGYVAGVWRAVEGGIELSAFHELSGRAWSQLEHEASALAEFLAARDPGVYRRYGRWWQQLPVVQTRLVSQ